MPRKKISVLVVDDDKHMSGLMAGILEVSGYHALIAGNGESALEIFETCSPDLVLLDVMMPGMDGYAVCRRIREFSRVPIIMVTGKGAEDEKVQGLEAGADDYVSKPFSARELAARVRAVLRRSQSPDEPPAPVFCRDDLTIDFVRHKVTLGEQDIELTATEYGLLSCLARNAGRVLTADQMLEDVWGETYLGESHLLWINMARIRKKLGDDPKNPRFIHTRPGIGYIMPRQS